jgi:hypothetical protein
MLVTVNLDSFWVGFVVGVLSLLVIATIVTVRNTKKLEQAQLQKVAEKKTPGKK